MHWSSQQALQLYVHRCQMCRNTCRIGKCGTIYSQMYSIISDGESLKHNCSGELSLEKRVPQWRSVLCVSHGQNSKSCRATRLRLRRSHPVVKRSLTMASTLPGVAPLFPAGREPLPPGLTEEDREVIKQQKYYQDMITEAPHSCLGKGVISMGAGA